MMSKLRQRAWQVDLQVALNKYHLDSVKYKKLLKGILTETTKLVPQKHLPPNSVKQLSVLCTSDSKIRKLNKTYRHKDKATDVLSFSQLEGQSDFIQPVSLGDLVISLQTTKRQALEYGVSFEQELLRLSVHGILHLFGFDHENVSKNAAKKMFDLQDLIIKSFYN